MTSTTTCSARPTRFDYTGAVATGVEILFSNTRVALSAGFLSAICENFSGKEILGGFSMTDPSPAGLGEWVAANAVQLNGTALTPRHASFIAAILRDAGKLNARLAGNAVCLTFPRMQNQMADEPADSSPQA